MNSSRKISEIPANERPYEKCVSMGPQCLSDAELLAVIIGSLELSEKVLYGNPSEQGLSSLMNLTLTELMQTKGIGTVKGIQILCIGEISKRIWKRQAVKDMLCFNDPDTIASYYREDLRHREKENLVIMYLNTKNKLIKDVAVSVGTVNSSLVSPREIFIDALRYKAVYLIMIHNHPSGDPTPSRADEQITKRIKSAGELLGVLLLDHIIIGDKNYFSFKREGML